MESSPPTGALSPETLEQAAAEAPTAPQESGEVEAAPREPPTQTGAEIPTLLLVQAGLTVFAAVMLLIYLIMWQVNIDMLAAALRKGAWLALLLAMAPVFLGAHVLRKNKKEGATPPGSIWAHVGVYVGSLMASMTLLIPVLVTVRSLVSGE
jgi:hypothetical protein